MEELNMIEKYLGINMTSLILILINFSATVYLIVYSILSYLSIGAIEMSGFPGIVVFSQGFLTIPMIIICIYIYKYRQVTLQKLKTIKLILIYSSLVGNLFGSLVILSLFVVRSH